MWFIFVYLVCVGLIQTCIIERIMRSYTLFETKSSIKVGAFTRTQGVQNVNTNMR